MTTDNITYTGLVDIDSMKRLQETFCKSVNVFALCIDENGQWISDFSGNKEEVKRLKEYVSIETLNELYRKLEGSKLEEQLVEETEFANIKMAGICIRVEGRPVISWIICGILDNLPADGGSANNLASDSTGVNRPIATGFKTTIDCHKFDALVDMIREFSSSLIRSNTSYNRLQAEVSQSKCSQMEMGRSLKRSEALTEVVQHLESDDHIERLLNEILKVTGNYLNISCAHIFRLQKDGRHMDVIAEWNRPGRTSAFDQLLDLERPLILSHSRPLIISSDTKLKPEEKECLQKGLVKAIIILPVYINNVASMYVCFDECESPRVWELEEVKFVSDAVKIIQSVLVRRIQKNSLAASYTSLEAILDNVGSAVYVRDVETNEILFANKLIKKNFAEDYQTGNICHIFGVGNGCEQKEGAGEFYYRKNKSWYDVHNTYITWVDGKKVNLCSIYDISDKKVYQQKIEQQANTDFLTGLYNRMCCERDLAAQIDRAKKGNQTGGLLYLDLDDFKHINDGLGHQYGDVLLKSISHSLQRIDGIEASCYRMGGDEFVIIVPPSNYPKLQLILDEIKEIFNRPWFLKDADYYCTMSMGAVTFPDQGDSVQELIKMADIAMYEAKKSGKNRVAFYSSNINSASGKRLDMEKNMRDASVEGYREFEIYYQPIIDIQKEGSPCTGAEALIRWNNPEMGYVPPGEFIPLAEYLGLINPIGNYVLKEACKACKYWNDTEKPGFKVNVNLSVVQLLQTDIVDIVENTLKETGLLPHNLTLEVTESLAINDMERMKDILARIKALGVRIALDDFGTGYSSLNHIREIPFDVIKVDQSFVKDLAEDPYSQSFIKMVSELADTIGVNICIEGIETKEQYKVLEGMKVSLIQGYYFDQPMTREDFEQKYLKGIYYVTLGEH